MNNGQQEVDAEGAPPPERTADEEAEDEEFRLLEERFQAVSQKNKRRTMEFVSSFVKDNGGEEFVFDNTTVGHGGSGDARLEARLHERVEEEGNMDGTKAKQPQSVTVENSSDKKLPRFSGSQTPSQGEVTFRKWHRAATRLLDDHTVLEDQKKKLVLKSLQGEADDIAELNRSKSVAAIVDVLNMNYGSMVDGEELLIEFYNLVQGKESASAFLSRLYIELGEVVKFGGISVHEMDKVLIKQFVRCTTDNEMS